MPRQLGANVESKLRIVDPATGETIVLLHRQPTTPERIGYAKSLQVVKKRGQSVKVQDNIYPTRIRYGSRILTGFEETAIDEKTMELAGGFEDENGKTISSNPDSEHFREDWKETIIRYAPELIEFLARKVFEGVVEDVNVSFDDDDDNDDEEGETLPA